MPSNYIIVSSHPKTGKTTTALNLALCLLTMGKKVQLIGLESNQGLAHVLSSYNNDNPLLKVKIQVDFNHIQWNGYDFTLIDCPSYKLKHIHESLKKHLKAIVPVTMEFYGLEEVVSSLNLLKQEGIALEGVLPVMLRSGKTSLRVLEGLKERLKTNIFESYIPRNIYLAMQFDYNFFELEKFTEKAGITYLNLANELIERESVTDEQ